MLIQMFVLKVINNERKVLTRREIINCIAEQIVLVINRVCKESMNLRRSSVSFTYLFKFTYFCFVHVWTLKKEFCFKK